MHARRVLALSLIALALAMFGACASGPSREIERREGPLHHYRLARMYFEQGRVQEAYDAVDEALRLDETLPQVHFFRGTMSWQLGRFDEAAESFRRVVTLTPLSLDARMYLAASLERQGRPEEALRIFDEAIAMPGLAGIEQARLNKALVLRSLGRLGEALSELREAVETRPRYYRAHFEMAGILEELGRDAEALAAFAAAQPGFEDNALFHYRYGAALFRQQRLSEAERLLRRAVELAPGSEPASRASELLKVIG